MSRKQTNRPPKRTPPPVAAARPTGPEVRITDPRGRVLVYSMRESVLVREALLEAELANIR